MNFTTDLPTLMVNNTTMASTTSQRNGAQCTIETSHIVLLIGYAIVFIIGSIGNTLVLISFRKKWRKGSTLDLLISYLALFDLLASIFVPWLFSYWIWTCSRKWDFGWFGCKVLPLVTRIFPSLSIGILLIMAIDRCRIIVTPFKARYQRSTIHKVVFLTFILSVASEIHYIYALKVTGSKCVVHATNYYIYTSIHVTLFRDVAFVSIFMGTTIAAFLELDKKMSKALLQSELCKPHHRTRKVMRMFVVMATVFGITVIPRDLLHVALSISYLLPSAYWIPYTDSLLLINKFLKLLQTTNSVYNVFIYAGMHKEFWTNIRQMLCVEKRKNFKPKRGKTTLSVGRSVMLMRNTRYNIAMKDS